MSSRLVSIYAWMLSWTVLATTYVQTYISTCKKKKAQQEEIAGRGK
jgi:hypothetical protein